MSMTSSQECVSASPGIGAILPDEENVREDKEKVLKRDLKNLWWTSVLNISVLPFFACYWLVTILMFATTNAVVQSFVLVLFLSLGAISRLLYEYSSFEDNVLIDSQLSLAQQEHCCNTRCFSRTG